MIESKWISLKPDVIAPAIIPGDAAWARESPSPYDVPTHIRSYFNKENGILVIEFKYIANEDKIDCEIAPYIRLSLGKHTHRIYSLKVDIHTFNRDRKKIAETAETCLAQLPDEKAPTREITLRAIRSQERAIFEAVA